MPPVPRAPSAGRRASFDVMTGAAREAAGAPRPRAAAPATEPAGGLRARRKLATREALAEAAVSLFAARGFDAVAVEDIAAAAGVSRRTFFRYFPSKEAAFFAGQEERLDGFRAALADHRRGDPPLAGLRRAALAIAARYEHDRDEVLREHALLQRSSALHAYDAQLDGRWEGALRAALQAEGADADDTALLAGALLGVMRAALREWFESTGSFDLHARGGRLLQRMAPLLDAVAARLPPARPRR